MAYEIAVVEDYGCVCVPYTTQKRGREMRAQHIQDILDNHEVHSYIIYVENLLFPYLRQLCTPCIP